MAQILGGETITDVAPGKTVTSARLNNMTNGAALRNGAILDQSEKTAVLDADYVLLGDSALTADGIPKKALVSNLQTEAARNGSKQFVASDTGAANAYVVALTPAATAYTAGMVVRFIATNANTSTSTINVNTLGAKTIHTRAGGNLAANDILAGQLVELVYDGTYFQMPTAISASEVTATHAAETFRNGVNQYVADTGGSANTYVTTLVPAATALTAGMVVRFKAAHANTGDSTLAVNGLGTPAIKKVVAGAVADLLANDIQVADLVTVTYDGSAFLLTGHVRSWDYVSTAAATLASGITDFTHGLGATPTKVRVVLVCSTAQAPWALLDELDAANVAASVGDPKLNWWVDATNGKVRVAIYSSTALTATSASGVNTTLTNTSWKLKVYASL